MKKDLLLCMFAFFAVFLAAFSTFAVPLGTDDDNVYYFPQEMAEWCSLTFSEEFTEQDLQKCFEVICSDYANSDFTVAQAAKRRYAQIKKEALINAFLAAFESKKAYVNSKQEDRSSGVQNKSGESERSAISGDMDIEKEAQHQKHELNRLKGVLSELRVILQVEHFCPLFATKQGAK